MSRAAGAALAVAVGAVVLRLLAGGGMLGYDASWALLWGDDLAEGGIPDVEAPGAPTPHPLANLVSAPLGYLGFPASSDAVLALSWLSLAALGWVAFRLGRELFSPWVGAVFALLLVSRPLLLLETRQAIVDVPFLALVAGAGVCALRDARDGLRVPALLVAAGLLRPEGWLVAIAWLAWAAPAAAARRRLVLAALAAAAPVTWAALDLAATGDPLFSLHVTQGLAEQLDRPRELGTAIRAAPDYLRSVMTEPVAWIGLAGAVAALAGLPERALPPAAVAGLGLAAFLALGVAGLPLLTRYLLLPATILLLFAAVAAAGFTAATARRSWWLAGGVAALVGLALSVPLQVDAIADADDVVDERRAIADDLEMLLTVPAVRAALSRCNLVTVPDDRPRPLTALALDRSPRQVAIRRRRDGTASGLVLSYAGAQVRDAFRIGPAARSGVPAGARVVAANESWIVTVRRCDGSAADGSGRSP